MKTGTVQPDSAYFITPDNDPVEPHILTVIVRNEPGVLARVIGLFSGRGYNIESLTVSETEYEQHLSRITIMTRGTAHDMNQIRHQLDRIIPVCRVIDLNIRAKELGQDRPIERELALVKLLVSGSYRVEALRLAEAFGAKMIDATIHHFIFEVTGKSARLDQFFAIMRPLGQCEICRTGIVAMNRGAEDLEKA